MRDLPRSETCRTVSFHKIEGMKGKEMKEERGRKKKEKNSVEGKIEEKGRGGGKIKIRYERIRRWGGGVEEGKNKNRSIIID